jgi:PBP1b-binding outer membrane lipoprotein LpoB
MNKIFLFACAALIVGCDTPASYKDPNGRELVVSLEKVNIQDFATAGSLMLQSMVNSPAFSKGAPVLQLGMITNDTANNFDTSLLLSKITNPLVNAGRVTLLDSDSIATAARSASGISSTNVPHAEYVLKGKILEDRANAGSTRQSSYVFQLSLVEVKRGVSVWQEEKIVTKQGSKNSIGF